MAGRPKKKPEYNPELQFNNFLQELRDAYEEADSLRSLADELNISLLKLRKLLITADVFTSDICTEINDLYVSYKIRKYDSNLSILVVGMTFLIMLTDINIDCFWDIFAFAMPFYVTIVEYAMYRIKATSVYEDE